MKPIDAFCLLETAIEDHNHVVVHDILNAHPDLLDDDVFKQSLFLTAAQRDNVVALSLLVELGTDVNMPHDDGEPEGVIEKAAWEGAFHAVRWLLDHGARVNYHVNGISRCFPLTGAVIKGHLEIVKLLIEHGAELNAEWKGRNALTFAMMYDQDEIAEYLRSKGGIDLTEATSDGQPEGPDPILDHIEKHLGKASAISLQELIPGEPPITIYQVPSPHAITLVTSGMSALRMNVPKGKEAYRFAELCIQLPKNWPLSNNAIKDPSAAWPIDWLLRIARYPHAQATCLEGPSAIIANGEPPESLAPNVQFTCMLALAEASDFGWLLIGNKKKVVFYSLYPVYTEERDLERRDGIVRLVELFQKYGIDTVVDNSRPNVALLDAQKR